MSGIYKNMEEFSFRDWLADFGDLYWEGIRDISKLPTHNINLEPLYDDDDEEEDYEEEAFDEDDAWNDCYSDADDFNSSDYEDEPVYSDVDDDPDFEQQTVDDWMEENPEPSREDFESEEDLIDAQTKWFDKRDEVQQEYDDAVSNWEDEMERRKESAERNAEEARDEYASDCVQEKRSDHESEQESKREKHEREQERKRELANNKGYVANFKVGSDMFEVEIERMKDLQYQDRTLEDVFSITFALKNSDYGFRTSNKNSSGEAMVRYNHLLAAVAKMVQEETSQNRRVNGFEFSAAQPAMGLMYQKFYKDYLKPAGYLRVSADLYLLKDYIREFLDGAEDWDKNSAFSSIVKSSRDVRKDLNNVRSQKALMRSANLAAKNIVGKVVMFRDRNQNYALAPGFVLQVTKINPPQFNIMCQESEYITFREVPYTVIFMTDESKSIPTIAPIAQPIPQDVIPFLYKVKQQKAHLLSNYFQGSQTLMTQFNSVLTNYGIPPVQTAQPQQSQPAKMEPVMV